MSPTPPPGRPGPRARARRAATVPLSMARLSPEDGGHRWVLAVDMDGVLHGYTSGWQGAEVLPDPPVPGAIAWLEDVTGHFEVAIHSTRCASQGGRWACLEWLERHGLSREALAHVYFPEHKPSALLYVEDRGWRFDGQNFPTVDEIRAAKPWGVAAKMASS